MLLVIMGICIACIVLVSIFVQDDDICGGIIFCNIVLLAFMIIASIVNLSNIVKGREYEKQIEICQEEITNIENTINPIVESYLNHEKDTYVELSLDTAMAYAIAYPELMSNTIISQQISMYNDYLKEIKELKLQIASITTANGGFILEVK